MKRLIFSICCAGAFLLGPSSHAATIHVPGDHPSIQQAIEVAAHRDTVLVAPGTYMENLDFLGKGIHVRAQGTAFDTMIGPAELGSVVVFMNGEGRDSILEGFTLWGGTGTHHPEYGSFCGGNVFCMGSPTIRSNIIRSGSALYGTGLYIEGGSPLIVNNVIEGNEATYYHGGAVHCRVSNPIFTNDTIAWNKGAGLVCGSAYPTLFNCIVWGNPDGEIVGDGPKVSHSLVRGGYPGEGNIDAHPLFRDGYHKDMHLISWSPCKDAGTLAAYGLPSTDFEGNPRILFDGVDLGADEIDAASEPPRILNVPWEYAKIQAAIDDALPMDTVLVQPGLYKEKLVFKSKSITVKSALGPKNTILFGDYGPVVRFEHWETADAVLQGFTITNGHASGKVQGGGIYCFGASPRISGNVIAFNSNPLEGGGVSLIESKAELSGNTIQGNATPKEGGGIFCEGGGVKINGNVIRDALCFVFLRLR